MLPRRQRTSATLSLLVPVNGIAWRSDASAVAAALAHSLLGTPSGVVRCVLAHFAKSTRVASLVQLATQLCQMMSHPVHIELRPTTLVLHARWEIPLSALTGRELRLLLLLAWRRGVFAKRTSSRLSGCKYDACFNAAFDVDAALFAFLGTVAVMPCGFLALPLATLLRKNYCSRCCL